MKDPVKGERSGIFLRMMGGYRHGVSGDVSYFDLSLRTLAHWSVRGERGKYEGTETLRRQLL